jgi:hypothetical protein
LAASVAAQTLTKSEEGPALLGNPQAIAPQAQFGDSTRLSSIF